MARSSERSCSRPVSPFSYALYSSFSPYFQKYLESLYAVHSAVAQADGAAAAGHTVRRDPIETIHPVVRVNPATMLFWAALIVVFTLAGLVTLYLGLVVTLPLLGHASWHAYRDLVRFGDRQAP